MKETILICMAITWYFLPAGGNNVFSEPDIRAITTDNRAVAMSNRSAAISIKANIMSNRLAAISNRANIMSNRLAAISNKANITGIRAAKTEFLLKTIAYTTYHSSIVNNIQNN